jgi:RNA polymerase sigma-70 factor, ECF subfamily
LELSRDQFRNLVERHQSRVFSIAWRILGDSATAEEVAQDVFLELHKNLRRLESEEHITAWLRRVACCRATDALRRRSARPDAGEGNMSETFSEGLMAMPLTTRSSPLMNRVEHLVLTLPPAQRAVVLMRYQEDLEPEEIAGTLSMPLATVRSHLQRAVKCLRTKAERTLKEYIRG